MKKSMKIFALAMTIGFCGLLTSNATTKSVTPMADEDCIENEDDLRCVLYNDTGVRIGACWFCDCASLAENLQ